VTDQQIHDAIFNCDHRVPKNADQLPWWGRLLGSLRVELKLNSNLRKPIKSIYLKGRVEF
jgi:hypothetical protein